VGVVYGVGTIKVWMETKFLEDWVELGVTLNGWTH